MTDTMEFFDMVHFTSTVWILGLPAMMMAIDILTGLVYALVSNTFQSARMRTGLGKKFGELSYIVIGAMATVGLGLPEYILKGISIYIIFMEVMSILENAEKLGAPVPAFIKKAVNNVNESLSHDEYPDFKKKLNEATK